MLKSLICALLTITFSTQLTCLDKSNIFIFSQLSTFQEKKKKSFFLKTGWYAVNREKKGVVRKLRGSTDSFYLDSISVINVEDFKALQIIDSQSKGKAYSILLITLNDDVTEKWSETTKNYIGGKLAFVLNDELITTPAVNMQVKNGISSINDINFSRQNILEIKLELEKEINAGQN